MSAQRSRYASTVVVGRAVWRPLQRLAAREAERRVGEDLDGGGVSRRGQLREGAREQVVARRARGRRAVDRPGGRLAAAEVGAVDQVVVDERRHVHELDRDAGRERRLRARRSGEEDERGPEPLAARGERLVPDGGDEPRVGGHGPREPLLERVEIVVEPRHRPDVRERCGH